MSEQSFPLTSTVGSEIMKVPEKGHNADLLERGIVTASSTVIDLLGIDLIGIRQIKIVTTLDTWLNCAGLIW